MSEIVMDKKEEIVMKLVHYLVTKENYTPIVVNGVKNEIWLENQESYYKIVRINSNTLFNKEQMRLDAFKVNNVAKQVKKKTLSFKMNVLNILLDGKKENEVMPMRNIDTIYLNTEESLEENKELLEVFPEFKEDVLHEKDGLDLIINATNDINSKTAKNNQEYESVFTPKKIIVTKVLIGICLICFALQIASDAFTYFFANQKTLVQMGQYYRLITCGFLHANIIHLACNLFSLYIIGSELENFIGKKKFIVVYFVSLLASSLMSIVFSESFSLGASGAIFGLMGALLYFGYHYRLYLGSAIRHQLLPVILINLCLGFTLSGIDNAAHIGGLIGGFLSMMTLGINYKSSKNEKINGLIVTILYLGFLTYMGLFM